MESAKHFAGPWCVIPLWHNLDTIPVPNKVTMVRVRPDRTEQAVATAFLLQKQLYVYGRPVWRLFLNSHKSRKLVQGKFAVGHGKNRIYKCDLSGYPLRRVLHNRLLFFK